MRTLLTFAVVLSLSLFTSCSDADGPLSLAQGISVSNPLGMASSAQILAQLHQRTSVAMMSLQRLSLIHVTRAWRPRLVSKVCV